MKRALTVILLVSLAGCGGAPAEAPEAPQGLAYPAARVDDVVDTLHGEQVPDPYRWLEDDDDPEVQAWQEAQTALAREQLAATPGRDAVRERLAALFEVDAEEPPVHKGKWYFQKKRKAGEDQPVLWVSEGFPGEQRALVDPGALGQGDNTVALDWWYPSWDGELLAYGLSDSGSERSTLHVLRTATGEQLDDQIPNTRSCLVAWLPDGSGFFYTRRPEPGSDATWFNRVHRHTLGQPWVDDPLVFGEGSPDEAIHYPQISPDGSRLVITIYKGSGASEVDLHYRGLAPGAPEAFTPIAADLGAAFYADVMDDKLVVLTNHEAPRYRVLTIDYDDPAPGSWKEIIPEGEDTIDQILVVKDRLLVKVMHHAASRLYLHAATGERLAEVALPALGTVTRLRGQFTDTEAFFGFTSFFHAGEVHRFEIGAEGSERLSRVEVPVDPERFAVEQVFFTSKDGTKVPMFVARLADAPEGPGAALLTGYGGFNIAITPYFLGKYLPFIEAGGTFAVPNLRGGSEYGEEWHRAGMRENKQNVFDDFIAAAEHLVESGVTTPERLVIRGGSNGGLLVGAAMTQRPELFGAVICQVPLLDMVRFHKFLIARLWVPEYGSADDPEGFAYIRAYSPYHNVEEGVRYPATLITAAVSDSRVAPLHARKMAALLQARTAGDAPILLQVEPKAGHGKGKPISKKIDEAADILGFAMHRVGLEPAAAQ